jgi:hypothetical protein
MKVKMLLTIAVLAIGTLAHAADDLSALVESDTAELDQLHQTRDLAAAKAELADTIKAAREHINTYIARKNIDQKSGETVLSSISRTEEQAKSIQDVEQVKQASKRIQDAETALLHVD